MQMNPLNSIPAFGLKKGALMLHGVGIGTVTRRMVFQRAIELSAINGGSYKAITKEDWDQAKRELTGDPDIDPKEALLESAPESERWDPICGSSGSKAQESSSEDEDQEGHSDSARLVEAGIGEAAHDQMLQATRSRQT
jgi:hypothetical protein